MIEVMAPGDRVLHGQSRPASTRPQGRLALWLGVILLGLLPLFAAMADRARAQTPSLWQGYTVENIECAPGNVSKISNRGRDHIEG